MTMNPFLHRALLGLGLIHDPTAHWIPAVLVKIGAHHSLRIARAGTVHTRGAAAVWIFFGSSGGDFGTKSGDILRSVASREGQANLLGPLSPQEPLA
jgi:hypothetical protein